MDEKRVGEYLNLAELASSYGFDRYTRYYIARAKEEVEKK
jgi:hypothetical protein